jgi:hypothetical protein
LQNLLKHSVQNLHPMFGVLNFLCIFIVLKQHSDSSGRQ